MTNKILFIIDKLELKYFEYNKLVTDFWLIKEFLDRKEEVYISTIDKLGLEKTKPYCNCAKAYSEKNEIFYDKNFEKKFINDFNMLLFRPDPPVDLDYINATYILDFADKEKTLFLNDTKAIRNFNEKLHTDLFYDLMPENIVTASKSEIQEFLEIHKELILKPLNNCFGSGVMYLKQGDKNTTSIIKTMTNNETKVIMVQKYIPLAENGDKRVLMLNGEVYDECVMKLPTKDDFKFNNHSMDYIKKAVLTKTEKEKFTPVAKKLHEMGLTCAGLDVIDEKIIEINITSPCFFINEINTYFSINLEKRIVDTLQLMLKEKTKLKI